MNIFTKFIIAISLILSISVGTAVFFIESNIIENNEISYEYADSRTDSYSTIFLPKHKNLKILQLTDPQVKFPINNYDKFGGSNEKTIIMTRRLIEEVNPDLVIFTGDVVMSQMINNWPYLEVYADLMEELAVYWTMSFGNHDSEAAYIYFDLQDDVNFGQEHKETIIDKLKKFPHCLISKGDAEPEGGVGNHFINIRDKKTNDIIYTLSLFDCVYRPGFDDEYHREKTPSQVEWYARHIDAISDMQFGDEREQTEVVKSLIFAHVPVPEIFTAYELAYNDGLVTQDYHYGNIMEGSASSEQYRSCGLFEEAVALKSTQAMFFGHYHDNDCNVSYQGINLVFGQHSGLSHYYRINMTDNNIGGTTYYMSDIFEYGDDRGGTLITISNDGNESLNIEQIFAKDVILWDDISINYEELYLDLNAEQLAIVMR